MPFIFVQCSPKLHWSRLVDFTALHPALHLGFCRTTMGQGKSFSLPLSKGRAPNLRWHRNELMAAPNSLGTKAWIQHNCQRWAQPPIPQHAIEIRLTPLPSPLEKKFSGPVPSQCLLQPVKFHLAHSTGFQIPPPLLLLLYSSVIYFKRKMGTGWQKGEEKNIL